VSGANFTPKNLTRSYRDMLLILRTYRGHGGLICPSMIAIKRNSHTSSGSAAAGEVKIARAMP
jgi:hypothetical protein